MFCKIQYGLVAVRVYVVIFRASHKNHLRNKFHFSEVHRSMNAMGPVQSKWRPHSTLYLQAVLCKVCKLHAEQNITNRRIRPLRSTAVVMAWRQSNVSTTNENMCLPATSLDNNGTMINWRSSMYDPCRYKIGSAKERIFAHASP